MILVYFRAWLTMKGNRLVRFLVFIQKYAVTVGGMGAAVILFLMMALIAIDVVGRAFGMSTGIAVEVSGFMLIGVISLGLAHTQRKGRNIQITTLTQLLSQKRRKQVAVVALVITTVFIGWYASITFDNARRAYLLESRSITLLHVPLWIPYLLVPLGYGLLAVELLTELFKRDIK